MNPKGSKLWPFKYRIDGRETHLSIGKYPDVGLARARRKRATARISQSSCGYEADGSVPCRTAA
ncbi:Arm DNA-binding domain-containing protein [Maritimibacter dapengensis]|uniref:Arm DNA-binding domain-containing protein n=1 Tax=Maritimibacter dapengensis TaxID=2836868 RepID=UPI003AB9858D